ncbi:hypothetical protein LJR034_008488 [Caballeronia sp. LjRoot34]|uniref:hypothetical protein n=1 Tax=Caballeronia sp. LjRoot34 TaxID=3342325 RepID=UPI003ECECDE0
MAIQNQPTPGERIHSYIRAKDGNRPSLAYRTFASHAVVDMHVKTSTIQFPSVLKGVDAIAQELVRNFATRYENIYTFCLGAPPPAVKWDEFTCDWFVCMSNKSDGAVRVGCGEYTWKFSAAADRRVERFRIVIEAMTELPAGARDPVIDWAESLAYPWCASDEAVEGLRKLGGLDDVVAFLVRGS